VPTLSRLRAYNGYGDSSPYPCKAMISVCTRHLQASEDLAVAEAAVKAPPSVIADGRPAPADIGELVAEGRGLPADPRLLAELTNVLDTVSEWDAAARRCDEDGHLQAQGGANVRFLRPHLLCLWPSPLAYTGAACPVQTP